MATAVSASSTSFLRLSCPVAVHQPQYSASAGIVWVPVPHNRCPGPASSRPRCCLRGRGTRALAVVEQAQGAPGVEKDDGAVGGDAEADGEGAKEDPQQQQARPCELYVCNLPRSCGALELTEMFGPFGTVQSVEVSRNAETGISKGCGFVTMSSSAEARAAISGLDGSDLMGREIRVKYSVVMVPGRLNTGVQNTEVPSSPPKDVVFESPHKIYVGNLAWSVTAEQVRDHFSQFGTVVSARLLHDKKGGQNRVYAFLSFSTADELIKSLSSSGTEFCGRPMMVREVV